MKKEYINPSIRLSESKVDAFMILVTGYDYENSRKSKRRINDDALDIDVIDEEDETFWH